MQLLLCSTLGNAAIEVATQDDLQVYTTKYVLLNQGRVIYNINELDHQLNPIVYLLPKILAGMQIFVRQLSGKTISIDLPNGDETTVQEIKQMLLAKEGVPLDAQALYNAGKLMENAMTIKEYGILAEAVIHLVINMSQISVNNTAQNTGIVNERPLSPLC